MGENSKANYMLAPITVSVAAGFWLGEKVVSKALDSLPFVGQEVPQITRVPEYYGQRSRTLRLMARQAVEETSVASQARKEDLKARLEAFGIAPPAIDRFVKAEQIHEHLTKAHD
jgi:hypothetical protein